MPSSPAALLHRACRPTTEARAPAVKAQAAKAQALKWRFNRRGVVTPRSHAYIRPSLGNAITTAGAGAARLLLSLASLVSFRAPIDSVVIQAGSLGSPRISFCLFAMAAAWPERLENEAVDLGVMLQ